MMQQLPLGIKLSDSASFSNYIPDANNRHLIEMIKATLQGNGGHYLYFWGATGTGKSHLLQGACHYLTQHGGNPIYLPLKTLSHYSADSLMGLETVDLLCLDDLQAVVGLQEWERAIFHLFNALRDAHIPLLITANAAPKQLDLQWPDLVSRLLWGGVFALNHLEMDLAIQALQHHAQTRGLHLPAKIALFLLEKTQGELAQAIALLAQLDDAALSNKKALTLPFVRQILNGNN
ncbi:DnaA regulatory inactivator Hda [Thioflexithrix psekupsensis]|uniref:DnaA regulatory inactivator Hda n=1 Tax=Thioflexithrix psekupsensis TaxID=1570016 RepID=A0A251X7R0_9GAMM|nr:DnaA regulatory inactivator Hda [Thioflexithrix psekupsensis]OUD14036.1 DnaA regulatory inactivator Hda [Thioflexithrix psekupsensis]